MASLRVGGLTGVLRSQSYAERPLMCPPPRRSQSVSAGPFWQLLTRLTVGEIRSWSVLVPVQQEETPGIW